MTTRRYVQRDGVLHEITEDADRPRSTRGDAALWNDRNYENQGTTDGVDISSRSKHKAYMKKTGLTTFDDYKSTFRQSQEARDAYHSGERPTITKRDIERSIHELKGR